MLAPFGGAGPLHAARVAEDLGVTRIVVPPSAGVISAYGLIASDFTQFSSLTRRVIADDTAADVMREAFAQMRTEAVERARSMRLDGELVLELFADMRFVGQAFEVPVGFDPSELAGLSAQDVRDRFREAHHRVYFFRGDESKPVEFVSFRLGVTLPLAELPVLTETETGLPVDHEIDLFDDRRWWRGRLVSRARMRLGEEVVGPALLEDPTSTVFLPAGWVASRDDADNTTMIWRGRDA